MNLFSTLREKSHERKHEVIQSQAQELITLNDFENRLYIAYSGNPLVVIEEDLPAFEVLKKLQEVRGYFIDAKMKNVC